MLLDQKATEEEEEEKKKPLRRKTRNSHFAVGPGVQSAF